MAEVTVPVTPAINSKINITQLVSLLVSFLAMLGLDVSAETLVHILLTVQTITTCVTIILRTWYTASVTPTVADKMSDEAPLE